MKKICLSLLLLVIAATFFSACGQLEGRAKENTLIPSGQIYGYSIQFTPLPKNMALITDQCSTEKKMYICGLDFQEMPVMYEYNKEQYSQIALPDSISYIHACCITQNGVAILAGDYPSTWTNSNQRKEKHEADYYELLILLFDGEGQLTKKIDLSNTAQNGTNWDSIVYKDGFYYLMSANDYLQISSDGGLVNSLHLEGGSFISQTVANNVVISLFDSSVDNGDDTVKVKKLVNEDALVFETIYTDQQLTMCGMGFDKNGNLLLNMGDRIIALDTQYKEDTVLYDFYSSGILNSNYSNIYRSPNGYLLASSDTNRIAQLIYGKLSEKKELLLWLSWCDKALNEWIEVFNQTNTQYAIRVEIIDISNEQSRNAVRARMISGDCPDLYFIDDNEFFGSVRENAVFENLFPYIDKSSTITRDSLLNSVIHSVTEKDCLYIIPVDITILTMCQQVNLLPQEDLDISDMLLLPAVQKGEISIFPTDMTQESLWYWLSTLYIVNNLNENTGECLFDTPEYINLLNGCANSRRANMHDPTPSIFSFQQLPGLRRVIYLQNTYGDDFKLLAGLGATFHMEHAFAISNTSSYKDGAWQFIEFALSYDLSAQEYSWPVMKDRISVQLDRACTTGIWFNDVGEYTRLTPSTAEEIWQFFNKNSGVGVSGKYPQLIQIMREEATKFFSGDKSAEDVAKMTQSRAQIYLSEQFG